MHAVQTLSKYEKLLILLFLLSLPFVNPWVRGDGVGYYAFVRAPLIEHRFDFRNDWMHANASFRMGRFETKGQADSINAAQFTRTGHLDNHFAVGPAMLWAPFLVAAHGIVIIADAVGGHIVPDGFSRPYVVAMALSTALYGFGALWISFALARKFVPEGWAFAGTLGIWLASSLPIYMYFNPSWSHAQSAFMVAVFLWYWLKRRNDRTVPQWLFLGLMAGLMMDVYYINAILLVLPLGESVASYLASANNRNGLQAGAMLGRDCAFSAGLIGAFLPTLITKKIIYGSLFNLGYTERWFWNSPAFFKVLFSADHGFLTWTPVLALAVAGLVLFARRGRERTLGWSFLSVLIAYVYVIGCYQDWDGISSFGNRFFVSLTPLFVIGLAVFFQWLAAVFQPRRAAITAGAVTAALVLANFGLMFQWGTHLIPPRGAISWGEAAQNDVAVVPKMAAGMVTEYLTRRSGLMSQIEKKDVDELKSNSMNELP